MIRKLSNLQRIKKEGSSIPTMVKYPLVQVLYIISSPYILVFPFTKKAVKATQLQKKRLEK